MAQTMRPSMIQMDVGSLGPNMGMRAETATPGPNQLIGGGLADLNVNPNQSKNMFGAQQNQMMNGKTAEMLYTADAERGRDTGNLVQSGAEYKANLMKNMYVNNILENSQEGVATMALANPGVGEVVTRDAMINRAIANQLNPDLGDYSGQLMA
jgi:hypothetical protein